MFTFAPELKSSGLVRQCSAVHVLNCPVMCWWAVDSKRGMEFENSRRIWRWWGDGMMGNVELGSWGKIFNNQLSIPMKAWRWIPYPGPWSSFTLRRIDHFRLPRAFFFGFRVGWPSRKKVFLIAWERLVARDQSDTNARRRADDFRSWEKQSGITKSLSHDTYYFRKKDIPRSDKTRKELFNITEVTHGCSGEFRRPGDKCKGGWV